MTKFAYVTDERNDGLVAGALASMRCGDIDIGDRDVRVTWGDPPVFDALIPRSSIRSVSRVEDRRGLTRGVHGLFGRWPVNTANHDLVKLTLRPPVRAQLSPQRVLDGLGRGGPLVRWLLRTRRIRLRELTLSVHEAANFVQEVRRGHDP